MSYTLFLDFNNAIVTVKYETKEAMKLAYKSIKETFNLLEEMKLVLIDKDYVVFQCKDDKKCTGKFARSICKLNNIQCSDCVWYEETTCTKTMNFPGSLEVKMAHKN